MLSQEAYKELEAAVGPENISQEPAVLDTYAFYTFFNPFENTWPWQPRPAAVILPGSTEEVQALVKTCNKHKVRFKAHSVGWGGHAGPGDEGILQVDLRRMNRILELDEKNMYAVVEPAALCSQVHAEAMKHGLTLHIIGAGCNTSPLASVTSGWGAGWTGLTTSISGRIPLALEWVLPSGDIMKIGSIGTGDRWFCGDGPGPSIRGVIRGYCGAFGGLGIFTKGAVKLFPCPEPKELDVEGLLFNRTKTPPNIKVYMCALPSFKEYANFGYKVGDADIGFMDCKNAIGLLLASFAPRMMKRLADYPTIKALLNSTEHTLDFMLIANSRRELEYQEKVLKRIIEETRGVLIDLSKIEVVNSALAWGLLRGHFPALAFRMGGTFVTGIGGPTSWDNAVLGAETGKEIKQKYIDKGLLYDDLADNAWGSFYEGCHFGAQEELGLLDPRDHEALMAEGDYVRETNDACIKRHLGIPIDVVFPGAYREFGPAAHDYHLWLQKIKSALDEDDLSDSTLYIPSKSDRAKG